MIIKMKTLYTILFFIDVIFLVLLTSGLFKQIDEKAGTGTILLIICGMVVCIVLLVFILLRYIREPLSRNEN
jgi:hypothetical protein